MTDKAKRYLSYSANRRYLLSIIKRQRYFATCCLSSFITLIKSHATVVTSTGFSGRAIISLKNTKFTILIRRVFCVLGSSFSDWIKSFIALLLDSNDDKNNTDGFLDFFLKLHF